MTQTYCIRKELEPCSGYWNIWALPWALSFTLQVGNAGVLRGLHQWTVKVFPLTIAPVTLNLVEKHSNWPVGCEHYSETTAFRQKKLGRNLTWVDDLIIVTERHPWVLPLPLWSLNIQIPLLNGEGRNPLIVGSVELCQVLSQGSHRKDRSQYTGNVKTIWLSKRQEGIRGWPWPPQADKILSCIQKRLITVPRLLILASHL